MNQSNYEGEMPEQFAYKLQSISALANMSTALSSYPARGAVTNLRYQ